MDKWAPIAPSKPGGPSSVPSSGFSGRFGAVLKPSKPAVAGGPSTPSAVRARGDGGRVGGGATVGKWPEDIIIRVVGFLPVHDVPNFARANRALARIARDETAWEARCRVLGIEPEPAKPVEPPAGVPVTSAAPKKPSVSKYAAPGRSSIQEDDFGDFSLGNDDGKDVFEDVDFGDFESTAGPGVRTNRLLSPPPLSLKSMEKSLLDFDDVPLPSRPHGAGGVHARTTGFFPVAPPSPIKPVTVAVAVGPGQWYKAYKRCHLELIPLCLHLRSSPSPSSTLSLLFPPSPTTSLPPPLSEQSSLLLRLLLFLSARVQPVHDWGFLRQALLAAADRFDSTCLVAFELADSKRDEERMRVATESSWKVWEAGGGARDEWECGRVWIEKREVFYETNKWDATENIIKVPAPTGTAIVRELDFTPMDAFMAHVLESFRLDAELAARVFPPKARVVHSFCERVSMDVLGEYIQALLGQTRIISQDLLLRATAAAFVQAWKLVDVAMEVLGSEQKETPRVMVEDVVYRMFEVHMDEYLDEETEWVKGVLDSICSAWDQQLGTSTKTKSTPSSAATPQFLTASNPDQVKRNVLANFRDVLLLPVTIVPRTVTFGVNAIVSGSTQAVNGLSMLNPQKWAASTSRTTAKVEAPDDIIFEVVPPDSETPATEKMAELSPDPVVIPTPVPPAIEELRVPNSADSTRTSRSVTPSQPWSATTDKSFDSLQLLVSLDTALELIHGDRDSLKRTETFANYPSKCGRKVRETIEEIFILLLKAVGDRHIAPGFRIATKEMSTYKPAEHEETTSVAPLLQFFELVHVGDTIQSMVQVYFDKELAQYVDKTDFLNAVMREKKRFEAVLDDAVAAGLNAGIEVLMNQVEHIILVKTGPREYYPEPDAPLDLGPTLGCREAIACLEQHCNLLKGSTSKEVLEVFYQEVGIRLQAILQRHLKRQIISLEGGFQIIADLNAYHSFVASLKQQRITDDFSNLKMLGHVFIVSDAKDLAQIVRDVTRYGGTFRPEDIYEFIQRRSDWKKIEKTVDKAMYALSVREDCIIM